MILEHTDNAKATCVFLTKLVLMQRYDTDQLGSEVDTDDNDDGRDDNGMMLKMLMMMMMMMMMMIMNEVMLIKTLITATLNLAKRQNCDGKNYDDDDDDDVDCCSDGGAKDDGCDCNGEADMMMCIVYCCC